MRRCPQATLITNDTAVACQASVLAGACHHLLQDCIVYVDMPRPKANLDGFKMPAELEPSRIKKQQQLASNGTHASLRAMSRIASGT